jgi:hypothetical protein
MAQEVRTIITPKWEEPQVPSGTCGCSYFTVTET